MTNEELDDLIERLMTFECDAVPQAEAATAIQQLRNERDQNDINYGLEKADHERTKEELATVTQQRDELAKALSAMLTHMGMDEDEWSKVTFDQARSALAKLGADKTGDGS